MYNFCSYDELMEHARESGIAALARLYANVSSPDRPFMWDVAEEANSFFYDGHDPQHPPEYWLLDGEEAVLGDLLPRKGLTEGEFRRQLPTVELTPSMRAVGVVKVIGYFQFITCSEDLKALVAACGYSR